MLPAWDSLQEIQLFTGRLTWIVVTSGLIFSGIGVLQQIYNARASALQSQLEEKANEENAEKERRIDVLQGQLQTAGSGGLPGAAWPIGQALKQYQDTEVRIYWQPYQSCLDEALHILSALQVAWWKIPEFKGEQMAGGSTIIEVRPDSDQRVIEARDSLIAQLNLAGHRSNPRGAGGNPANVIYVRVCRPRSDVDEPMLDPEMVRAFTRPLPPPLPDAAPTNQPISAPAASVALPPNSPPNDSSATPTEPTTLPDRPPQP